MKPVFTRAVAADHHAMIIRLPANAIELVIVHIVVVLLIFLLFLAIEY